MSANELIKHSPATYGFSHINRYWDKYSEKVTAKILPGECYVTKNDEQIVTVLGSCVSACIRDIKLGVGGMNHFMLPEKSTTCGVQRTDSVSPELCYGNWAMEFLLNSLYRFGAKKENLEIKIFGGANLIAGSSAIKVGFRNIEFIEAFFKVERLNVVARDVAGDYPRKIIYYPKTGKVRMKNLKQQHNDTILKREITYRSSVSKPVSGNVELF